MQAVINPEGENMRGLRLRSVRHRVEVTGPLNIGLGWCGQGMDVNTWVVRMNDSG